jgi:hypothetical protein
MRVEYNILKGLIEDHVILSVLLVHMPGFDELISQRCLGQTDHYACSWTFNGISFIEA